MCVGEGRSEGLSAGPPGQVLKELRDARLPAFPMSFIMDATGGYPGGVWYSPLLFVTARPVTEAPVTALYFRGRRCTAAPNAQNRPTLHVPQPLLHGVRRPRATSRIVRMAVLTEPVPRRVRQV